MTLAFGVRLSPSWTGKCDGRGATCYHGSCWDKGSVLDGHRVPILGPAGIFKPAVLPEMPLSITTVPVEEGEAPPYRDVIGHEGLLRYCYRGTDPSHNLGSPLSPGLPIPLGRRVRLVPAVPETEGSEGGCLDGGRVGCRRTAQRAWLFLGISA